MNLKKFLTGICIISMLLLCLPVFAMADEDAQNPVMNFVGTYVNQRARLDVAAGDNDTALITVSWADSAFEHAEWSMSGSLDTDTLTVSYSDCTKKTVTFNEEGTESQENIVYTDGTGTITFNADGTLTWDDETEHIAQGSVFEYIEIAAYEALFSDSMTNGEKYIMYVGTADKDTGEPAMPFDEARSLADSICARYVSGYTRIDAGMGMPDENGTLTQEDGLIYVFFNATEEQLQNIMNELIESFNLGSILIEKQMPLYTLYSKN